MIKNNSEISLSSNLIFMTVELKTKIEEPYKSKRNKTTND